MGAITDGGGAKFRTFADKAEFQEFIKNSKIPFIVFEYFDAIGPPPLTTESAATISFHNSS
jgi:hypothetical protein